MLASGFGRVRAGIFAPALFAVLALVIGCAEQQSASAPRPAADTPTESAPRMDGRIFIDSVPSGATVKLLPADEQSGEAEEVLGKTPLVIEALKRPSLKFLVWMEMDEYLKQLEAVPQLKEVAERVRLTAMVGTPGMSPQLFRFDTPQSQMAQSMSGGLHGIGPVYDLDWPKVNRICVLFIPVGTKASDFYALMPPDGTHPLDAKIWKGVLMNEYHCAPEQAEIGVGCLRRCGHCSVAVPNPEQKGFGTFIQITVQGGANELVQTTGYEGPLLPGYND